MAMLGVVFLGTVKAAVLVATDSTWAYFKGLSDASTPREAWREAGFDDRAWASGRAPFHYDTDGDYTGNTALSDMRTRYTSVFLRTTFDARGEAAPGRVRLRYFCDDGFVLWINGVLVAQANKSTANLAFNAVADAAVAEPLEWRELVLPSASEWWHAQTNGVAVQGFNASLTSSDFIIALELISEESDRVPPRVVRIDPVPGTVSALNRVTVEFSEPVTGLGFSDLLINERPAHRIVGSGTTYRFEFDPPAYGDVVVRWDPGAQIEDLAVPPNRLEMSAVPPWTYRLMDLTPPSIVRLRPSRGSQLRALETVEVIFDEPVMGVDAGDLLVNGAPAVSVVGAGSGPYVFHLGAVARGAVNVAWAADFGIRDLAEPANAMAPGSWSYQVDPQFTPPPVRISEFLAANSGTTGVRDEDGELQDWIELENPGPVPADLTGWTLTDDPDDAERWEFPPVQIPSGGHLIVFASGKDRRPVGVGGSLHTNFKLGSGGEYLALFSPDSTSESRSEYAPVYPPQRNDVSYGRDAGGMMGYFVQPTPGRANGMGAIPGALPRVDFQVLRGIFETAFDLRLSCAVPGAQIRYTLDGSDPTLATGQAYGEAIRIDRSRVVRATAFLAEWLSSPVETHSYLFPRDAAQQSAQPPGMPAAWEDASGRVWAADYEMDPEIVNAAAYRDRVIPALRSLPALSLVTRPSDLFDNTTGIYPKSQQRGASWERAASVEVLGSPGEASWQADCGVQMQGNSVRDPVKTAKHSFRLLFKGDYGESKLRRQFFPDSPVDEFDTLILRADFNNSWMHWNGAQRPRGQRVRDAWMKESQRAMGGVASHSRFFHLYLNGLYWGVYDATERPDATFAASYLGGDKSEYDVVNEGQAVDGDLVAYQAMRATGGLETPDGYERMQRQLDVPAYIDYLLLHFYAGHEDWFTDKNWYASRRHGAGGRFRYHAWDGELMLNAPGQNIVTRNDQPSGLHARLLVNPEYRMAFADRVQRHCFGSGALTPAAAAARYESWVARVEQAMVAESARWGDYRRDVHRYSSEPYELYTADAHFQAERRRLVDSYFPARTAILLAQLKSAGLYPARAVAPTVDIPAGRVVRGTHVTFSATEGAVYYTLDGSDPRVPYTAQVSASARVAVDGLVVEETVVVKARSLRDGEWSALSEVRYEVGGLRPQVAITEIHYHPLGGDPYEFIELWNHGNVPVDLSGYTLSGVGFLFPAGSTIEAGRGVVMASALAPAAFAARYPNVMVHGWFDGQLSDAGERLTLRDPAGRRVLSVEYDDENGWPILADGSGPSLELLNFEGDPEAPSFWTASARPGGSPGQWAPDRGLGAVRLSEVHAARGEDGIDWLEIHHSGTSVLDLGGWSLSDTSDPKRAVLPPGTLVAPDGYLVIACSAAALAVGAPIVVDGAVALTVAFSLEAEGETVSLHQPSGQRVDAVTYGPQVSGWSLSRDVVMGLWGLGLPTPRRSNQRVEMAPSGSVVLNEWLADAPPDQPDWLELYNRDLVRPAAIDGYHLEVADEVVRIGVPTFVAPGGYLVLEADGRGGAGHLGVKLPAEGAVLGWYDAAGTPLERATYSAVAEGVTVGRLPDGAPGAVVALAQPTPGRSNLAQDALRPVVESVQWQDGSLRLRIRAAAGTEYGIEASQDLRSWTRVWTARAQAGTFDASVQALAEGVGFYRVMSLP